MTRARFLPAARGLRVPAFALALGLVISTRAAQANVVMIADGPGETYELLGRVFTIETPDCGHKVQHITEEMDDDLHKPVFVFYIHVNEDDDRCGANDRQRTEIRGGKLPEVVASNGQTVYYRWKFKLPMGFQTSSSFTHIFQIKSDAAAPVMTLTPRGTNLSIDGQVGVRGTTPLAKFLGVWVAVDLKLIYGGSGHIDMTIRRLDDGEMLLQHSGDADTWQGNGSGHDPKFGIYRSLHERGALRDEQVRFADFCISKESAEDCDDSNLPSPGDAGSGAPEPADAGRGDAGSAGGTSVGSGGSDSPTGGTGGFGGAQRTGDTSGQLSEPDSDPTGATDVSGSASCGVAPASAGNGSPAVDFCLLVCTLGLWRRRRRG
jgi:hypothetical protein